MPAWTRKHLLGLEDLTRDEVVSILDRAETYLETARNPRGGKAGPPMPAYTMSHDDADAIVTFLKSLQ